MGRDIAFPVEETRNYSDDGAQGLYVLSLLALSGHCLDLHFHLCLSQREDYLDDDKEEGQ